MTKQILLILLFISTLTFTGCAERGQNIIPAHAQKKILKHDASSNTKTKNLQKATVKVKAIDEENRENAVEDSTKNTITGILVLIIGIMVFI